MMRMSVTSMTICIIWCNKRDDDTHIFKMTRTPARMSKDTECVDKSKHFPVDKRLASAPCIMQQPRFFKT